MANIKSRLTKIILLTFAVALPIAIVRVVVESYPAGGIHASLVIATFILGCLIVFAALQLWFKKRFFLIACGGVIYPLFLIFIICSCFYVSPPTSGNLTIVIYQDNDLNKARVVENVTFFNPFECSTAEYRLTGLTTRDNSIYVGYAFAGTAVEFHNSEKKDSFQLMADSALMVAIDQSAKDCQGFFLNQRIAYLDKLLRSWPLPEGVVLTGKFGLVGDSEDPALLYPG